MKKKNATAHTRTYPSTQRVLKQMALDNDTNVPEIIDRLSKTGDPTDPKKATPVLKGLKQVQKGVSLKTVIEHRPDEYFKSGTGLYVWDNFKERVLVSAKSTKKGTAFKLNSFDLVQDSTDEQIEAALPKNHLFDASDVCVVISELIAKQKKGEDGALIMTGYANLFYTEGCVVRVRWRGGDWGVDAWLRDDNLWRAGYRVFSPATDR